MEEEKLGKVIIDGKVIDLDKAPLEELRKYQSIIAEREQLKRKEIKDFLNKEDEELKAQINEGER